MDLLHPAESLVSHQVGQNIKVLVAGVTEVDIHTLGQVGVARVVTLTRHQLLLHPHIAQLRLALGSLGDSRVLEVFLVVVLVLGSEGHEELLGGSVEQRPSAVPVVHHLEVLDAAGEGDELPAELQEVEAVVEGVAGLDGGPEQVAGPPPLLSLLEYFSSPDCGRRPPGGLAQASQVQAGAVLLTPEGEIVRS